MVPNPSTEYHEYQRWVSALIPLPVGAVLEWVDDDPNISFNQRDNISKGQRFIILETRNSTIVRPKHLADLVQYVRGITKSGKLLKRDGTYYVWGICKWVAEGKMRVVWRD